jgi:hypothetical protein
MREGTSITTITTITIKFWWHGGVRKQQIQQGLERHSGTKV